MSSRSGSSKRSYGTPPDAARIPQRNSPPPAPGYVREPSWDSLDKKILEKNYDLQAPASTSRMISGKMDWNGPYNIPETVSGLTRQEYGHILPSSSLRGQSVGEPQDLLLPVASTGSVSSTSSKKSYSSGSEVSSGSSRRSRKR